jgi:uncharacterized membrane protein YagU involved in acid resistance
VIARGIAAGIVGTAVMTAAQVLPSKLQSSDEADGSGVEQPQDPWESAPVPARVAKKIGEDVFGRRISADRIPLLTNVMHWGYGTSWGVVYAVTHPRGSERPLRSGVAFGVFVWAMSYVQLVPLGFYEPPWKYGPEELAMDLGYHLAYGAGLGMAEGVLTRHR